jgi:hypothetical protein
LRFYALWKKTEAEKDGDAQAQEAPPPEPPQEKARVSVRLRAARIPHSEEGPQKGPFHLSGFVTRRTPPASTHLIF